MGQLLVGPNESGDSDKSYIADVLFKSRDDLEVLVRTPSEIKQDQLLKLVVNAVINPLTAVFDCKNKCVLNKGPRAALFKSLIHEIGPVVRQLAPSEHWSCDGDLDAFGDRRLFEDENLMKRVDLTAVKTGANTSSMLQDVRRCSQTEIDYINGYIVAQAERLELKCPHNKTLVQMVSSRTVIKDDDIPSYFPGV
jgi:2-dehydropantoate 2-reductase